MPKPRILLFGPAPGRMEPSKALEMLRPTDLPGLTKCVLTAAKFDTQKAAKTFNIEANYAPEPVRQQTLSAWAGDGDPGAGQLADGIELFALRAILERDGPFDFAILQRRRADLTASWQDLRQQLGDEPFLAFGKGNLVFNLRGKRGPLFLETVWELYSTGAVYALDDYSFEAALGIAANTLDLRKQWASPKPQAQAEADTDADATADAVNA